MLSMRWAIVLLIFRREARDQLRDRRTLFMIFILPMLLYPILGIGTFSLAIAFERKPRTVVVLGAEHLPDGPRLLDGSRTGFDPALFDIQEEAGLYRVVPAPDGSAWADPSRREEGLRTGQADAVLIVPPDIRARIADESGRAGLEVVQFSPDEKSRDTARAVRELVDHWKDRIVGERLRRDDKPETYLDPVRVVTEDVASLREAGESIWAKFFPFLLVMMALTGAFYPAVDLCAGEKERGTMETLLISPASRHEIVMGKFLTVMVVSMGTALLNLLSMGLTGMQMARMAGTALAGGGPSAPVLAPPSLTSAFWMVLLLVPLSAFLGALCVALAVMARSMKEGQYYMTPLYMVALPLIFVTLVPGIELTLFTSLVPITGVSLLLRTLMQGDYVEARRFFLPVLVPVVIYGAMALRWAVDQFQRESVLFREAERFDLPGWLRHLVRDREPTPNSGMALFGFALMLSVVWFSQGLITATAGGLVAGQVAIILAPPVLLGVLFTSSPRRTFRLAWPSGTDLLLAVGLALALNPLMAELRVVVETFFPVPKVVQEQLGRLTATIPDFWTGLLVLAIVPAVCEETAFRGFILSGLERDYRAVSAIVLSAFLFGFLHVLVSLFQQLFGATLLGIVLGLLAMRSRSLLPGIVFHAINNGLAIALGALSEEGAAPGLSRALLRDPSRALYRWYWVALGALAAAVLLAILWRRPARKPAPAGRDEWAGSPGPGQ